MDIQERLLELRDEKNADFQSNLLPGIPRGSVLGIKIPVLRTVAKELKDHPGDRERFLSALPHEYYDENILHGVLVSDVKDAERCAELIDAFLPYVDNWAVCDTLRPKCFKRSPEPLRQRIPGWLASEHPYTVRCGIGMLMAYFLNDQFRAEYLEDVARTMSESPCREEYYVRMMAAWYFATALAKQYDAAVPYIENRRLDIWTHNKTIQKAVESYRVTPEHKEYLRSLRIKA